MIRETALKRFKRLAASGIVRASASAAMLFGVTLVLLPGGGVASATGTTGFAVIPPSTSPPITISKSSENCGSYLAGANDPKVSLHATSVTSSGGTDTIDYSFDLNPEPPAVYNTRICEFTVDSSLNFLSTIGEAEFDNIPANGGFTFSYCMNATATGCGQLPPAASLGSGKGQVFAICTVSKTQQTVNHNTEDRKSDPSCLNVDMLKTTVEDSSNHPITTSQPLGTTVHDTATLTDAASTAGGTVSYELFSNGTCDSSAANANPGTVNPVRTDTKSVTNGSVADDDPFTASFVGSYSYLVTYSGDQNPALPGGGFGNGDLPATASCEPFTITAITPTLSTAPSATNEPPGTGVTDTATVTGNATGGPPGGSVSFHLCTEVGNAPCNTGGVAVATAAPTAGTPDVATSSNQYTSDAVNTGGGLTDGTYCFWATFTSTSNNYNAQPTETLKTADQECFTVTTPGKTVTTTGTTLNDSTPDVSSTDVFDNATVTPSAATGSVDFVLFSTTGTFVGTAACNDAVHQTTATGVAQVGSDLNEALTSGKAKSINFGPLPAGNYGFQATYNGDASDAVSTSDCEPFTVAPANTETITTAPVGATSGAKVTDSATVKLASGDPLPITPVKGTVTFALFGNDTCKAPALSTSAAIPVDPSTGTATSPSSPALPAGSYGYLATYSGDSNYNKSTGVCEPFNVGAIDTTTTTSVLSGDGATAPASTQDQATVAPVSGSFASFNASGSVTFTLYSNPTPLSSAAAAGTCLRQGGTAVGAAQVVKVDPSTGIAQTTVVTGLAAGNYGWQAAYSMDLNYNGSTATCEPFTVNAPAPPPAGPAPTGPSVTGTKSSVPPSGSTVAPGTTVVYTMTLTNSGQTQATGMTETDNVPSGTTFVSANNGGTDNSGTVTWSNLNVPAGGSISVSFTVTVNTSDSGITITNVAQFTNVGDPGCTTPTCPTNVVTLSVPKQPVMTAPTSVPPPPPTTTTTTVAPTTTTTVAHPALAFTGAYTNRVLLAGAAAIGTGLIVFLASSRRRQGTAR